MFVTLVLSSMVLKEFVPYVGGKLLRKITTACTTFSNVRRTVTTALGDFATDWPEAFLNIVKTVSKIMPEVAPKNIPKKEYLPNFAQAEIRQLANQFAYDFASDTRAFKELVKNDMQSILNRIGAKLAHKPFQAELTLDAHDNICVRVV